MAFGIFSPEWLVMLNPCLPLFQYIEIEMYDLWIFMMLNDDSNIYASLTREQMFVISNNLKLK